MRIDLHAHSNASDGTEPPAVVVAAAQAAGLDAVALTDHDSAAGWEEAAQTADAVGIALVRGMEMSARHLGVTVHLLSYLHDPTYPPLVAALERVHAARRERAQAMVERLARDYPIDWESVARRAAGGAPVGRPHIADELVALGAVPSRSAAFERLLHPRGPYYVRYWAVAAQDAIGLIRAAGGVPVFAHPGATGRQRLVGDDGIVQMHDAGLFGLEVRHRDNPPEQRVRLTALARRLGLAVTGGSDYHGAGKANRLGENLTAPEVFREIIALGALPLVGRAPLDG
ncbi:MAG: PHP domain-containing protein [Bifidobacteriaceae bacterium]|jgi:predicted metal-dependent phosphoesterase TrpH|nr:PHP domain-containing protein [Bifidobacteriaceae bacterium]